MSKFQFVPGLRRRVLEHIISHPKLHRQRQWTSDCGTAHCIGGWAILLSFPEFTSIRAFHYYCSGDLAEVSAKLLGLSEEKARSLFFCMDKRKALRMLKKLVREEEEEESNTNE